MSLLISLLSKIMFLMLASAAFGMPSAAADTESVNVSASTAQELQPRQPIPPKKEVHTLSLFAQAVVEEKSFYPAPFKVAPENKDITDLFTSNNANPFVPLSQSSLPDIISCSTANSWGLTFDDGPSSYTPTLLAALKRKNLKATFFLVGSRALANPEIVRQIHNEGHQLAIHTWSHPYLTTLPTPQILAELYYTAHLIHSITGFLPKFYRPPYGDIDDKVRGVAARLGLTSVMWSRDTRDWDGADVVSQFKSWTSTPDHGAGTITLEHDIYEGPVSKAIDGIDVLVGAGLKVMPVGQCIGLNSDKWYSSSKPLPQFSFPNNNGNENLDAKALPNKSPVTEALPSANSTTNSTTAGNTTATPTSETNATLSSTTQLHSSASRCMDSIVMAAALCIGILWL